MSIEIIRCKRCNKEFESTKWFRNYCSNKCKSPNELPETAIEERRQHMFAFVRSQGKIPFPEQIFECKFCGKEFKPKTSAHGKIFCSRSCSSKHRFSVEGSREEQSKKNKEWSRKYGKPKSIKPQNVEKNCLSCGDLFIPPNQTKFCEECSLFKFSIPLFNKIGLSKDLSLKIRGTMAKEYLIDLYYNKKLSMIDIQRDYKINMNTLHRFAKKMNFKMRTLSDGLKTAFAEGRKSPGTNTKSFFKQGWHTTWEGNEFYYRSSYEYDMCNELNENKISYEMESIRIQYYDSQKQKTRTALPDFHLSQTNEIWEVKSTYFFNKINMQDKFKQYKKLGYECKLILEHKEYSYDDVLNM